MTFPLDSSRDCARAWEAMPWVLQGSAPQEQSEWLTQHLETCVACRTEFDQQSRLRLALSLPADVPLDPAVGLEKLMARLDRPEPAAGTTASPGGSRALRFLVAAVLIQAIGIGVLSMKLWDVAPPALYRTHSLPAEAAPAGAIHVVPDTTMTLAAWDALLKAQHLKVVDGPNDVGAYTVVSKDEAVSPQQALERLRTTHGIRFAEPVVGAP
jgi:predicted anti-sigma-YlaC factor YlaD